MTLAIRHLTSDEVSLYRSQLVELLVDGVNHGASVSFIAPLDPAEAAQYWDKVAQEIAIGHIVLMVVFDGSNIVGSAQLVYAWQPNGPHRAEVVKVLVHSASRRQGIGTLVMRAIEEHARAANRTLLYLDTQAGSTAEKLYAKLGYQRSGIIPRFSLNFDGSEYIDTVIYYKLL